MSIENALYDKRWQMHQTGPIITITGWTKPPRNRTIYFDTRQSNGLSKALMRA